MTTSCFPIRAILHRARHTVSYPGTLAIRLRMFCAFRCLGWPTVDVTQWNSLPARVIGKSLDYSERTEGEDDVHSQVGPSTRTMLSCEVVQHVAQAWLHGLKSRIGQRWLRFVLVFIKQKSSQPLAPHSRSSVPSLSGTLQPSSWRF